MKTGNPKRNQKLGIEKNRDQKVILKQDPNVKPFQRATISSGIEEYSGDWGNDQVAHLLRRCFFGLTKDQLTYFSQLSMSQSIQEILTPETPPEPPVNDYNNSIYNNRGDDPDVPIGQTWVEAPRNFDFERMRLYSLKSWIINQILHQGNSIHQKLNLFWHNLIPTEMWNVNYAKTSYQYWMLIHENAFGNYKDFIKKITVDPCMLFYLNGFANNKNAPDENYARELQELFCVGKGPNSGYTEADVQSAARVLTGYTFDWQTIYESGRATTIFNPNRHFVGDKAFSSFYNDTVITGRSGEEGADELDDLLDMIFSSEEVSYHIVRKLYTFFVYHKIDEATESNVIAPLAEIYRNSNYQIQSVLEMLLKSAHFYDAANFGAYIKNPVDHYLGLWRSLDIQNRADEPNTDLRLLRNMYANWNMEERGMSIGDPPSVAGWQAYYQAPSFDKIWISSDTILSRVRAQDDLIYNSGISGYKFPNHSLINLLEKINNPEDYKSVVAEVSFLLLGMPLGDEALLILESIIEPDPENPEWELIWIDYSNDPENEMHKSIIENRLKPFFQQLLQLGEFQLM